MSEVSFNLFSLITFKPFQIEKKWDVTRQRSFQDLHLTAAIQAFEL